MIRRLRRRHRWLVPVVAIVTAVILGAALLGRSPSPVDVPQPQLTEGER